MTLTPISFPVFELTKDSAAISVDFDFPKGSIRKSENLIIHFAKIIINHQKSKYFQSCRIAFVHIRNSLKI
jgi:hypothetical protein